MANPYAGEVALVVDGERRVLKLTLGALAELEGWLEEDSLPALVERFEAGRFKARDVLAVIAAGLRGGGWTGTPGALAHVAFEGGPVVAAQVAARALALAFRLPQ